MDFTKFCTTSRKKKEEAAPSKPVEVSAPAVIEVAAQSAPAAGTDRAPAGGELTTPPPQNMDELIQERKIPIANQIDLSGHEKAVSCISVEPAGNRVVTGSYDYAVKLYDFGGMDSRHRPFQSIEAQENHMVVAVSHSPSGDRFLVATGSAQPKVFDRDGKELIKFVRGDMYLRDLSNTKGHTMEVTGAQWHPIEKEIVLTSSLDGSLRVWNLQGETTFAMLINRHVLKVRGQNGANRLGLTCCCYSPNGLRMIGGAADGSIHVFNEKKVYSKADLVLRHESCADQAITCVTMLKDNNTLAVRCASGHVLLWDVHSEKTAKAPLKVISGLPNDYPTANLTFSPDGSLLCCATSPIVVPVTATELANAGSSGSGGSGSGGGSGSTAPAVDATEGKSRLCFFEVAGPSTSPVLSIALAAGATGIMVKWHPLTNQIFCTLSSGVTRVLFDPMFSKKGALLSSGRAPKRARDVTDAAAVGEIYNPLALPMYRTEMPGDHRKKRDELKDPYLAKIPAKPAASGPGSRPNNSFFFTNYVMKDRVVDTSRMEDPREALLKVDAEARSDPKIFGKAYAATQPQTQLYNLTFEQEQEEFRKKQKKL